jgi:hypothetical protein
MSGICGDIRYLRFLRTTYGEQATMGHVTKSEHARLGEALGQAMTPSIHNDGSKIQGRFPPPAAPGSGPRTDTEVLDAVREFNNAQVLAGSPSNLIVQRKKAMGNGRKKAPKGSA